MFNEFYIRLQRLTISHVKPQFIHKFHFLYSLILLPLTLSLLPSFSFFFHSSLYPPFQDEWLTCQRNWLYLESIFLAPDIKRQLPAESKMFLKVDKSWKEIMAKVKKMPNALSAATQPGR